MKGTFYTYIEPKDTWNMKRTFYTYIEGVDEVPALILATGVGAAADERVKQYKKDGLAEGESVTCYVFDCEQYQEACMLFEEYSSNWLDFPHYTVRVTHRFNVC